MENLGNSDDEEGEKEDDEEKIPEEGKRKRKRKTALLEKARQAMLDEYYKLDYEDTIGDLKTRFKYTKTKPNRYGLTPEELLTVDDKELNQYISLKKLAPYREEEWKLANLKRYQLKKKIKEILHAGSSHKRKHKKSRDDAGNSTLSNGEVDKEKADVEKSNVDTDKLSRKAKRRQRQADLKLSHSRLLAYNKTQSKSKGRRKH
ncbi:hypothetical protein L6164_036997 [Bauhinia variegata]|nr:hypothetical protein L6164_036997 [Bauhinia variegata]